MEKAHILLGIFSVYSFSADRKAFVKRLLIFYSYIILENKDQFISGIGIIPKTDGYKANSFFGAFVYAEEKLFVATINNTSQAAEYTNSLEDRLYTYRDWVQITLKSGVGSAVYNRETGTFDDKSTNKGTFTQRTLYITSRLINNPKATTGINLYSVDTKGTIELDRNTN